MKTLQSIQYKIGLTNDTDFQFKRQYDLNARIKLREHRLSMDGMSNFAFIVVEPHKSFQASDSQLSMVKARILLANKNDTLIKISTLIRNSVSAQLKPNESIFIFCNNYSCSLGVTIGEIQAQLADPQDGILYLKYAREDSFGLDSAYL